MIRSSPRTVAGALTGVLSIAMACAGAQPQESGRNEGQSQQISHVAPLEINQDKPVVEVKINGKGPFRFVIDTGTGGQAFISASLAHDLALPSDGQITLNDPSGQGGRRAPIVLLASVEVAGVEFTGVRAVVHNFSNGDGACQGLLGFALFRDILLTLDYPHRRMAISFGGLAPDGGSSVLPLRMSDGIPVVKMTVGATSFDAQIDSGGTGLSLPLHMAARLKFRTRFAALSSAHSLSTRFTMMGATLATDVHLGSYTFRRPFVEINPAFPLANFGSGPMQCFILTFDQKNRLVRFDAPQKDLRLPASPIQGHLLNAPESDPVDARLIPLG